MIPNIELTHEQLNYLLVRNKITSGGEAIICESDNPHTLYKLFWNYHKQLPMLENKVKKIELLSQMQLDYSVRPLRTISFNNMIIGYEMTADYDFNSYKLYQLSEDELVHFLKETKNILEYFSSKGIIYGDVNARNILFNRNTGEIKFCDIDNIQIGNYQIDRIPYNLAYYEELRGIDYDVHSYMHNLMTLEAYQLDLYYSSNIDIFRTFKYPAYKIMDSMRNPNEFDGRYLIRYKRKK